MIVLDDNTKQKLIELYARKNIALEGNILKLIDSTNDIEFDAYIKACTTRDKENRRKRLEITKQIQDQNKQLVESNKQNQQLMQELQQSANDAEQSKLDAESARDEAMNDLDMMQKRTQFELINLIVKVSLIIIIGVGVTTTAIYMVAMFAGQDTQIIGSTWSNMFGILLTNAFSIIGTIMGVKYASEKSSK
jgi:hypothetical protein